MISVSQLDSWLGKTITEICLNGYTSSSDNHCAHFVCHALQLSFGYNCKSATGKKNFGANLRVHELFDRCRDQEQIKPASTGFRGIVFVSASQNFVTRKGTTSLENVPKKHVGFLIDGLVWHYSNSRGLVIQQPLWEFHLHYPNQQNALWVGLPPNGYVAKSFIQG